MEDCDYCGASFDDEEAYVDHLGSEHADELKRIDQKRVEQAADGAESNTTKLLVGAGLVLVLAGIAYLAFFSGGNSGGGGPFDDSVQKPSDIGARHYHGTMNVTVGGGSIDFSQDKYQVQDRAFHFEGGNGERWHGHANGITLEYALETLDIGVTNSTLAFDGTTYDRSQGDTVVYKVNGQRVNPETYTLQDGDSITVVAKNGGS